MTSAEIMQKLNEIGNAGDDAPDGTFEMRRNLLNAARRNLNPHRVNRFAFHPTFDNVFTRLAACVVAETIPLNVAVCAVCEMVEGPFFEEVPA